MRQTARRLLGAAALLVAVTSATTGAALASPGDIDPNTRISDPRATVYVGNLEIKDNVNACELAGLPGTPFDEEDGVEYALDGETKIDILGFEGYTITGVVVKGSEVANIYDATKVNPLTDLISPLNNGGKVPAISHWFVCAEKDTTTTTTTTVETTTTTTATETTTTSPGTGDTTSVTTTTKAAGAPGSNDQLASTGFGSSWLLIVGLALVAAGAAFVASPKLRGLIKR